MARTSQTALRGKIFRLAAPQPAACTVLTDVPTLDRATLDALKGLLTSTGYLDVEIRPDSADQLAPAGQLGILVRLFRMGEAVELDQAVGAVSPLSVEQLVVGRFLRHAGKRIAARVHIQCHRGLPLALPIDKSLGEDTVMLVSPSSRELDSIMVRRHSRNTLDLGTGCGILALAAAGHSEHVTAIDINPRAIRFAEFNCRWNGFRNVTCVQGNCFEPVQNQKFDLIVTNPPFVISPTSRLMYRDSGRDGDAFCMDLARDAARLLNKDGYFQMIFQWIETVGNDWQERLLRAFSDMGCDVWVLRAQSDLPDAHVRAWMQDSDSESLYSRWTQYLERRGASSVGTGFCVMRRIEGRAPRVWFDDLPEECSDTYGDAVEKIFLIRERIDSCSDSELLKQRLVPSDHLRRIQESRLADNSWNAVADELALDSGMKYVSGDVDTALTNLLSSCDGKRTLEEVFEAARVSDLTAERLRSKYLSQIRELARYAFLIPDIKATAQEAMAGVSRPSLS